MSLSDQVKSIDFNNVLLYSLICLRLSEPMEILRMQWGGGGEMKQSPQMRKHPLHVCNVHAFLSPPE